MTSGKNKVCIGIIHFHYCLTESKDNEERYLRIGHEAAFISFYI